MILIRADGNARIGLGHLMRCLTVAEELAQQGGRENICFVCADEASGAFVRENGFRSHVLGTDYRDMESELPLWKAVWEVLMPEEAFAGEHAVGCICRGEMQAGGVSRMPGQDGAGGCTPEHQGSDGAGVSGCVSRELDAVHICGSEMRFLRADACLHKHVTMLVDSYYVTDMYLEAMSRMAYTILMDDYGTHCYPVDCVINYNAPADPEAYRKLYGKTGARLLVGSRYTPLRRQFRRLGAEALPQDAVRGVLITTGGGDSGNIAGKILKRIYRDDFTFHLVTGRFHPNFRELQELEKKHDNIEIHHNVKDMAGLMRRCQIALTAGGSTIYELAALGVPFICFSYAENQEALVEYIGEKRIAGSAGAWHKEPEKTLERIGFLFEELAGDPGKREYYRSREVGMVDGEGAGRLAREILKMDPDGSCGQQAE